MNSDLAYLTSEELSAKYRELCSFGQLNHQDEDEKQDILDILYSRGWRI